MKQYLELFIKELEEYIKQLNKELLALELNRKRTTSVIEVFRIFHTIKGMSQTMGFDSLSEVSHSIEDLLSDMKTKREISANLIDLLFSVTDFLTLFVHALKNKKPLPRSTEILSAIKTTKGSTNLHYVKPSSLTKEISDIRVKMEKLDMLFNLANELMIIRTRLEKISQESSETRLRNLSETASRLISSLQDEVMRLRMLPLSIVFDFFPRWFRDEAKRQKKAVDLEIIGGEIEVDRSIIDVLKEPLLHLLRNALDHGIELYSRHRNEKGKISLKAVREKERILISVSDNGRGVDLEVVCRQAIDRKIITEKESQYYTEDDFFRLLTHPDFSTKKGVSAISGRGIGLNIVNSAVSRLGGRLLVSSKKNHGSCFTLELPISLAIVRAMIFRLNGQRFALPLNFIQETFFMSDNVMKTVYHHELYPLRNEILPLVKLSSKLHCAEKEGRKSVIVVQVDGKRRGLMTDEIQDEVDIVVKKLDPLIASPFYSGCSIYADGLPILILDPRGF